MGYSKADGEWGVAFFTADGFQAHSFITPAWGMGPYYIKVYGNGDKGVPVPISQLTVTIYCDTTELGGRDLPSRTIIQDFSSRKRIHIFTVGDYFAFLQK